MPKRTVLIAGPTASGKTGLAINIAQRIGGIIINADALQVYSKWQVLTARPSHTELEQATHCLYGHVNETREYSVGEWIKETSELIDNTHNPIIIVGGTGLYFSALLNGLSEIPPVPHDLRSTGNMHRKQGGTKWFLRHLREHDPKTLDKLDQKNPARLQRAWEVLEATGKGLSYWHARPTRPLLTLEETTPILLNWEPKNLNDRIDTRFDQMMKSGALEECKVAKDAGFDPSLPANRALGAKELIDALDGNITMQDAVMKAKTLTHQFAKRQRTWFRSKMKDWQQIEMSDKPDLSEFIKSIPR